MSEEGEVSVTFWPSTLPPCRILSGVIDRVAAAGPDHVERMWGMATVLQRKFVDDEPCVYFDEESWHDLDRSEVRRNRGGLWQRGGYESYTADDEWETLEGSESQRLEAEYQRLVKAGEVEDIDTFLDRTRWIPVSERLPEEERVVLVAVRGSVGMARLYSDGWYWDIDEWHKPFTPTHWMPLPEPPEVK